MGIISVCLSTDKYYLSTPIYWWVLSQYAYLLVGIISIHLSTFRYYFSTPIYWWVPSQYAYLLASIISVCLSTGGYYFSMPIYWQILFQYAYLLVGIIPKSLPTDKRHSRYSMNDMVIYYSKSFPFDSKYCLYYFYLWQRSLLYSYQWCGGYKPHRCWVFGVYQPGYLIIILSYCYYAVNTNLASVECFVFTNLVIL